MKKNIFEKLRLFFRTLFFILGVMLIPILILDLLRPQNDYTMLWWAVVFSALLTVIDTVFDWIPVFREKLLLKRISLFVAMTVVLMGTSWIMGIIDTVPTLLYGVAGCLIAAVPATVILYFVDKKNADTLNDSLRRYNNSGDKDEF
jgi:O-antigen/teichoic acid export membrane protein